MQLTDPEGREVPLWGRVTGVNYEIQTDSLVTAIKVDGYATTRVAFSGESLDIAAAP